MPQQPGASIVNNFSGGLKTEFTGLNFPANSWPSGDNCIPSLIGNVTRRLGIDYEVGRTFSTRDLTNQAIKTYKWENAGGDGSSSILVVQMGVGLFFYKLSASTGPLSPQKLVGSVDLSVHSPGGSLATTDCEFATGSGFLFVFNRFMRPIFCSFDGNVTVTATQIDLVARDLSGVPDGTSLSRPASFTKEHQYNLQNQGWSTQDISIFHTALGVYPSNGDVWWAFKNSSGVFDPINTAGNVTLSGGNAPKGYYSYSVNSIDRTNFSGVAGFSVIATIANPRTGTWFQGRVWYAGLDASVNTDYGRYNWSEKIYFSQVYLDDTTVFSQVMSVNDPTNEIRSDLLPTDGGVIQIQGCGAIYKLFPLQNGLLVFAANGVWYITGSSGIGFSANDYTINKVSSVQSISSSSFVDVQGLPVFWNEEGIYQVTVSQGSPNTLGMSREGLGLSVEPLTVGTILGFYSGVPGTSKLHARGAYNQVDYIIQWVYKSGAESDITSRYEFDRVLCYNTVNKAFYTYSIAGLPKVHGVNYVTSPTAAFDPTFKYFTSTLVAPATYNYSFAEEYSTSYKDWSSTGTPVDYTSFFETAYDLGGKAITKFQPVYVYMYSKEESNTGYIFQGVWDFAINPNSGRYSTQEVVNNFGSFKSNLYRRHKIRGHGRVLQLRVSSLSGLPFDIIGWAIPEAINTGS